MNKIANKQTNLSKQYVCIIYILFFSGVIKHCFVHCAPTQLSLYTTRVAYLSDTNPQN